MAKDLISIIGVELYLEAFQAPMMEHGLRYLVGHGWSFFAKIVNVFYALTIFFMFSLDYSVIDYFDRVLNPANIYLFKVNNRNTRKRCEICSTLTIKTPE